MNMLTLIDLLLPKICVGCKGEGSWLCHRCLTAIPQPRALSCADCDGLTPDGRYCSLHSAHHEHKGLIFVGSFQKGTLREAIHTLKYNGVRELALPLSELLRQRLLLHELPKDLIIIPIPLHPARRDERGFNQAELIAKPLPLPVVTNILIRYRSTKPQAQLTHKDRQRNIQEAFGVRASQYEQIHDKTVLLVDDVATTGATLDAAAAVLKRAGAKTIWAAVLAKG